MAYVAWIVAIGVLLGYEWYAITRHKMTLSRAVWNVTARWPLLGAVVGFIVGVLFSHFWWRS
jgi:hypothetical protein